MGVKYSFVIPVYNAERYLKKCVSSILVQKYVDFEIILVDDQSNDNSGEICDQLVKLDSRIKTIHKLNEGPGIARNAGVLFSKGEFIIFCDADDYYCDNNFLHKIDDRIDDDTDIIVFDYLNDRGGNLIESRRCISELKEKYSTGQSYLKAALNTRYDYKWYPWLYVFRKKLFETGIVFPKERLGEDTATIYRLFLKATKVGVVKIPVYAYRIDLINNLTSIKSYNTLAGTISVAERCIIDILNNNEIDAKLKNVLINNFATAYFIALIQADNLSENELDKLISLLNEKKWISEYSTSKKQVVARYGIEIMGIRRMIKILGARRRFKLGK